jgi:hypothetical protein
MCRLGRVGQLQHRQAEGGGLAGAGLGQGHQITLPLEQQRDDFLLHRGGSFEAQFHHALQQGRRQFKVGKAAHRARVYRLRGPGANHFGDADGYEQ